VPVEIVPFGVRPVTAKLTQMGLRPHLRMRGDRPFVTDEGNYILDLAPADIPCPHSLAAALDPIPGVVCHGLFLNLAHEVLIGCGDSVVTLRRE
jgi:ribose 5-phosphate isomerase A